MARRSFRDRFYSPEVGKAVTSPSAILALGAGAGLGLVITGAAGIPLVVGGAVAGVIGGAVGYGARIAAAMPRDRSKQRIDPFGVSEPWRHAVIDAQRAQNRFDEALATFRPGPLAERIRSIGVQIDEAVEECWRVAQQGHVVAKARQQIDDREARWELDQARQAAPADAAPSDTRARRIEALEAQLATAARMDALITETSDRLDLLNARLDEAVTRAIELSVSNRIDDADRLGSDVGTIVDDMESLRQAIQVVDGRGTVDT